MNASVTAGAPVFSAERIAEVLAGPSGKRLVPTEEQRRVIEAPLEGSALVVAGAGSGKTETMANRVVWLVANGRVASHEVLGLTFTRKAAGELRERVTTRLEAFVAQLQDAAERGTLSQAEAERARELSASLGDGLDMPEISTYNAFAAGVLQEFGVAVGLAAGSTVIDEATAWRVAREVVVGSEDPALVTSDLRTATLIRHVLALDHGVADNFTSLDRVDQVVEEFIRTTNLPYRESDIGRESSGKMYAKIREAASALTETLLVTRLARHYAAEKRQRGLIEFSDQLALATRTLSASAEAVGTLRSRHRAVLLDEVQDTSVGQTRFLAMIFAGAPVMAVGDPHQSIYGWRGASAEGLASFHQSFRGRSDERQIARAETMTLSTSWRNPASVLTLANRIADPLSAESTVNVPRLSPRPGAPQGRVDWCFPETVQEERERVAEWMRDAIDSHRQQRGTVPSAAVIFRKRSPMASFAAELTRVGVPNRIVGLGGLLSTPEVTDVVSVLRCLWYADAGSDLIRILAGPRFRIGVADLAGLRDAARWFAKRDVAQQPLSDAERAGDGVLPDPDRQFTIVDALDALGSLKDENHRAFAGITPEGRVRLREAAGMFSELRQGVAGDVGELIHRVVLALRIDIELEANDAAEHGGGAHALANIDSFVDLAEGYLAIDNRGTLASLLEWVDRAIESDEAAEHVPEPVPGTVQLITGHGAKGLEWDIVAIPRLVAGEFPGAARSGTGWLRTGEVPDELRGDRSARPTLNWRLASTQKELVDRISDYQQELRENHAREERRLAYVAITRAAGQLFLSGAFWGGQTRPREPSVFLRELEAVGLITGLPISSAHEQDPSEADEQTLQWPLDPLGRRAPAVLHAAETVTNALEAALTRENPGSDEEGAVDETVELLLAEHLHRAGGTDSKNSAAAAANADTDADTSATPIPAIPDRITASTFHEFIADPEAAERKRLRPIPQQPYRRTRVGNQFHEWVERRATTLLGTQLSLPGLDVNDWDVTNDEFAREPELQPLIEQFERSRWAQLKPVAVELEVTLPFAGRTLVCKLDAVYRITREGEETEAPELAALQRFEVVDWKSGRAPRTAQEREARFFQLDLYRHAYAQWAGVDPELIDVTLFYVADGIELRGEQPRSLEALEQAWADAQVRVTQAKPGPL